MRLGFVNFSSLVYDVSTPYKKPMGGSESAMCYLASAMAKNGHKVTLFTALTKKSKILGVNCIPNKEIFNLLPNLDILVVQNSPFEGHQIRLAAPKNLRILLWAQHDSDQPAVESLANPEVVKSFDAYVLISDYQRKNYLEKFKLNPKKCMVLRNAISPVFENLFAKGESTLSKKTDPPLLAYTSTPFRGLNLLIQMFPTIKNISKDVRLKVFSSLGVYHIPKEVDEKSYGALYTACRNTYGVDYIGSVSQTKLAKELVKTSVLAYPNIFPETSCIAVMEAMAAGCFIVTSRLGALPETTAGFGKLIDIDGDWQRYGNFFIREILNFLYEPKDLSSQVAYTNKYYTWKVRAKEWEKWIKTLK